MSSRLQHVAHCTECDKRSEPKKSRSLAYAWAVSHNKWHKHEHGETHLIIFEDAYI